MPSATTLVAVLIIERPMCVDCISAKSGLKPVRVKATISQISSFLKVHRFDKARCRVCGADRPTFSIDRPTA